MTTQNQKFNTLADVESWGAAQGVVLTPKDRENLGKIMASERVRLEQSSPETAKGWADRWNSFYPRLLEAVTGAGETLLTFAQTVIVSLGVPTVLVLLLIVEHQRVLHGIELFETDYNLASFAAWALVLLNLVLEFQVHYVEHQAGYREELAQRSSLRLWFRRLAYWLGLGDSWTPENESPAHRYKSLLKLVTFAILALALVGSMRSVIEPLQGAWYEALVEILTDSSLLLILTWLGGLLFTAAAVLAAQGLSRYVAIRTVEIVADMSKRQAVAVDPHAVAIESAAARAAQALIQEKVEKRAAKVPFGQAVPDRGEAVSMPMNGSVNGHGGVSIERNN
ncbi:hypothetical protein [Thiocapsa sp. N5-Cardenillas]|uniref:hypothetical protein n=1 Tax=Thiocapsa sp. N5-Cardenillas TaxID=3137397 RepID=UPI0035B4A576